MVSPSLRLAARKGRKDAEAVAERLARRLGYELRRQHFYLPFPDVERLPATLWDEPNAMLGVDLRLPCAVDLLQRDLKPYIAEFQPCEGPSADGAFYLDNGAYGSVDAESLYGILRHVKPGKVVELGSGATSHVIELARRANTGDGKPFTHTIFDPFPFMSPMGPVTGPAVHPMPAERIDVSEIKRLEAGDVFFIDTTHTVRTGGDVVRVILDLLPHVASGVYVHMHDIFLPYEYPREWVVDMRRAWAEQYMLQAFLAFNETIEVVFPAFAVSRENPKALQEVIASFHPGIVPGAFWMRRV